MIPQVDGLARELEAEMEGEFEFENEFEFESESESENEFEFENEAEYERGGAEYAVIGPKDDRFHIPARTKRPGTFLFPFNTICSLEGFRDGKWRTSGTGTLIAPQVVLTAKHVLKRLRRIKKACRRVARNGPWRTRIRVSPGAGRLPDGSAIRHPATPASQVATSARFRAHPTLDFGVIILPKPFTKPNHFMVLQPRGRLNTATLLTIAGYPCDKPIQSMWGHSDRIKLLDVSPTHLAYTIDTCPGHSGSPIWLLGNDNIRLLLGIHTNGPSRCVNDPAKGVCRHTGAPVAMVNGKNCGVRLTCEVIDTILGWCQEFKVQPPRVDMHQYRRVCKKK